MTLLNYQTLKQKYEEYKEKLELFDSLQKEYEKSEEVGKDIASITIMDELDEIHNEFCQLRDELLDHLIESSLFELFKKEIMKE